MWCCATASSTPVTHSLADMSILHQPQGAPGRAVLNTVMDSAMQRYQHIQLHLGLCSTWGSPSRCLQWKCLHMSRCLQGNISESLPELPACCGHVFIDYSRRSLRWKFIQCRHWTKSNCTPRFHAMCTLAFGKHELKWRHKNTQNAPQVHVLSSRRQMRRKLLLPHSAVLWQERQNILQAMIQKKRCTIKLPLHRSIRKIF